MKTLSITEELLNFAFSPDKRKLESYLNNPINKNRLDTKERVLKNKIL